MAETIVFEVIQPLMILSSRIWQGTATATAVSKGACESQRNGLGKKNQTWRGMTAVNAGQIKRLDKKTTSLEVVDVP